MYKQQKHFSSTADLFPTTCFKCNVAGRKRKGKIEVPHKVTLQSAALKLKLAAIKPNDKPRIIQFNVRGTSKGLQYLMEKEIRTHDKCYTEYSRCLQEKSKDQNLSSNADVTGNILHCNNDVSMVNPHNLYETGADNVNARICRSKLKHGTKCEFGNQLLFLTINSKTPQFVVSSEGINSNTILKNKEETMKKCAKQLRTDILQYALNYSMPWPLTTETIA